MSFYLFIRFTYVRIHRVTLEHSIQIYCPRVLTRNSYEYKSFKFIIINVLSGILTIKKLRIGINE